MISDNSCHNMEPSWISMTGLSRTYFIIDKFWQIQSRYVINTTLPGVFSIRPVFGLGAVFALGLRPRANTGHLSQIPGRILKTPGNIVYLSHVCLRDTGLYLPWVSRITWGRRPNVIRLIQGIGTNPYPVNKHGITILSFDHTLMNTNLTKWMVTHIELVNTCLNIIIIFNRRGNSEWLKINQMVVSWNESEARMGYRAAEQGYGKISRSCAMWSDKRVIHRQYCLVFSVSALVFGWGAQYLPEAEGRGQIRHRGQIQGGYWKHQVMLYLLHTWTVFVRFCL